jgi:hypothetical protein
VAVVDRNKTSVLEVGKGGGADVNFFCGISYIVFLENRNFFNRMRHVISSGSTCLSRQTRQSVYHCVFVSCCDLLCTLSGS